MFVWRVIHHKYDFSNRPMSKADCTDQKVEIRIRSKMHSVNNLSVQNLFFPLHDAIFFQGHGKYEAQELKLGVLECMAYHDA
jgi:hypothetical protein